MRRKIKICFSDITVVEGELNETPTAALIWDALPIEGEVNLWGEEIYFSIPVEAELEDTAKDVVERGDLGYWPPGHAFCIFFGPTPMSQADEIRPASPVNIVGKIREPHAVEALKRVAKGDKVRLDR